jgi:hypothetical protein
VVSEIDHLFEHALAGNIDDAPGNDTPRLAAGMSIHDCDHAGESHLKDSGSGHVVEGYTTEVGGGKNNIAEVGVQDETKSPPFPAGFWVKGR